MSSYQDLSRIDEEQKPLIEAWEKHIAKHNIHPQHVIDKTWTHHDPELRVRMLDKVQRVTDIVKQHGMTHSIVSPNITYEPMVLSLANKHLSHSLEESLVTHLMQLGILRSTYSISSTLQEKQGLLCGGLLAFGIPNHEDLFEALRVLSTELVDVIRKDTLDHVKAALKHIPGVIACSYGTRPSHITRGAPRYDYVDFVRNLNEDGTVTDKELFMLKESISDVACVSSDVAGKDIIYDISVPFRLKTFMGTFTYNVYLFRIVCAIKVSVLFPLRKCIYRNHLTPNGMISYIQHNNIPKAAIGFFMAMSGTVDESILKEYSNAMDVFKATELHLLASHDMIESVSFIRPLYIT